MTSIIVKPAFTVDGWTANGVDEYGVEWFCHRMDGWFGPLGVRSSDLDRPTGDGTYSGSNRRPPRVITLGGLATTPDVDALFSAMDRFNSLLAGGSLYELVAEEPSRTLTAMVKLGDATHLDPFSPTQMDWQLVLVAPDPRKYGTVHESSTGLASAAPGGAEWAGSAGSTGVEWNGSAGTTGVEWQSGVEVTGIVTAVNNGNAAASVELVITAGAESISNPAVTDVTTQQVVSYGGTIPVGSTLIIDTGTGSVLLDGADRGALLSRADWLTVPRRSARQFLFTSSSSSPTASLMVRSQDTYI